MAKPNLEDYLIKIAPDFSVLDMVEKYAINYGLPEDNGSFQYSENPDKPEGKFSRGIYRVYPNNTTINISTNNCLEIKYDDSSIFIVYSNNIPKFTGATCIVGVKF